MADKYIGTTLDGRYEIQELVGEGGMANVYKGVDKNAHRIVAVKILKDEYRDNTELIRRFKNESRAISVLNHPNIVKVFDVNVDPELQYIVMEYIDGITLKTYIEQRGEPLTYKETVHFVSQVLKALQHAHDKGIVHRDIKPQNIMLLDDGNVKVMDFGIARLSRSESHTVTDQAIGSVHYISPEQAKGDATDPRADIYSLGITMYEMLTGRLPFESDNAVSIAIKQISDNAVPVRQVNPSVPPGLESITMRAMEKDPRRRYQGALDMLRDIEEFKKNPNIKFDYIVSPARAGASAATGAKTGGSKTATGTKTGAATGKNKKKRRKKRRSILVPIVGGITFVIVATCAILCLSIFQNSAYPLFGEMENIELPNFVGMQYTEVEEMLRRDPYDNLRLQEVKYEYKPGVVAGEVLTQNPTPPKQVKENQKIYLTISRGIESVTIPNLSGSTRAEGRQAILDLGMVPYVKSIVDSSVPVGRVITTDPAPGSEVMAYPDTRVVIYISSKPVDTVRYVPNLLDLASAEDAKLMLEAEQLQIGVVRHEYSDAPVGSVINQYPAPGAEIYVFTSVHITVSDGPEPVETQATVPFLQGLTWEEAVAAAGENSIILTRVDEANDTVPVGHVIWQNVPSGEKIDFGSTVIVTVSSGPAAQSVPPNRQGAGDTAAQEKVDVDILVLKRRGFKRI